MNNKVKAGIAATVAAASIATNLSFTPEELLQSGASLDSRSNFVEKAESGNYDQIEYAAPVRQTRAEAVRGWFLRLPVVIKAAFLLPLWAVGAIPVSIGGALLSGSSPVLSAILSYILQVGVLIGVFCVVYKLLFPNRKVTELFKKKNRRWLLLGAGAITLVNVVLAQCWDGWPLARVIIVIASGFGILCLLWYRVCHRQKKTAPAEPEKQTLQLEY